MLIACYGNIGPVISQAEGLAGLCFFSLPVSSECVEPASKKNKKNRESAVVVDGGERKCISLSLSCAAAGLKARGLSLCSGGNLSDCCVGETLMEKSA